MLQLLFLSSYEFMPVLKPQVGSFTEEPSSDSGMGINIMAKQRNTQIIEGQFDNAEDSKNHCVCLRGVNFQEKASLKPRSNLFQDWPQTNGQAAASNAAGALQGVGDRGFTPHRASTPERPASFSCRTIPQHKTDISGRASTPPKSTCPPRCASTPQRTTSVSHRTPISQQEMAFSNRVPAPRQSICSPRCVSASQQKTLAVGRGRGDFLKALVTSQGKPAASKGPGGSDVSVVMPVWGRGQALQKVLNMKKWPFHPCHLRPPCLFPALRTWSDETQDNFIH